MGNKTRLIIVGAGGLGREVLMTARAQNAVRDCWEIAGFVDADPRLAGGEIAGFPILGGDETCAVEARRGTSFICAIGNSRRRAAVVSKMAEAGCKFALICHPDVNIPDTVAVGAGTVIMAGTRFTTDARIGTHVIVYLNCSVAHDVSIGDYCLIASGSNLSGGAILEEGVELGCGANVLPRTTVGAWSVIGAGSTVLSNIPPNTTAVGSPCRVIKHH